MAAAKSTAVAPQRYERGSTIVTSNLPFEDWTSVFGSDLLAGALLDRLTHRASILIVNDDSYRLRNPLVVAVTPPPKSGRFKTRPPQSTPIRVKLRRADPDAKAACKKPPDRRPFLQTSKPR